MSDQERTELFMSDAERLTQLLGRMGSRRSDDGKTA